MIDSTKIYWYFEVVYKLQALSSFSVCQHDVCNICVICRNHNHYLATMTLVFHRNMQIELRQTLSSSRPESLISERNQ